MKYFIFKLVAVFTVLISFCVGAVANTSATSSTRGYLQLGMPACLVATQPCPKQSRFPFPVYIYKDGKQVGFAAKPSSQVIIGDFPVTTNNDGVSILNASGTYDLYYKYESNWYSCSVSYVSTTGGGAGITGNCPGAVVNVPKQITGADNKVVYSNVWVAGFGSLPQGKTLPSQLWPNVDAPPPAHSMPDYNARSITFTNNTQYKSIQISGSYCAKSEIQNKKKVCLQPVDFEQRISNEANKNTYKFSIPEGGA